MTDSIDTPKKRRRRPDRTLPARFEPRFWEDADARLHIVRRIRDRYELLKADAGADSAQRDILVQRATFLQVWLETQERQAIEDGVFDPGPWVQAVNALTGLFRLLGLERRNPAHADLRAYVESQTK
ncbi:MAG: hypothetical protein ACOC95_06665 [Planctomycetota bacterium]